MTVIMSEDSASNHSTSISSDESDEVKSRGSRHSGSDSASESSSDEHISQTESNEQNTWDDDNSSSDQEVLADKLRKNSSKKDEREMVMRVIQENPEDFGVRRSRRGGQRTLSDDSDDGSNASSDADSIPRSRKKNMPQRVSVRRQARQTDVNYGISSSDESDEDLGPSKPVVEETGDKIEKVLDIRDGPVGFTGNQTILYNDNLKRTVSSDEPREKQYLIKWTSWSNLHNTWESLESLKVIGCTGMRKLENFNRRANDAAHWLKHASPEEQEFHMIQLEMEREVYQQHVLAERIIARRVEKVSSPPRTECEIEAASLPPPIERVDYMIKWKGIPYSESTWEEASLCEPRFASRIKEFNIRQKNKKCPSGNNSYQKRPKFHKYSSQPEFVPEGLALRDYQVDGVNWLMHAWCKGNSCILADEMGLGKTIQTVVYLAALFHDHDRAGPYLCCVPLSTLAAWQHEFQKWAPEMNCVAYIGDAASRQMIFEHEWGTKKQLKFNVLITTYEIALRESDLLGSIRWAVLAIDEAHRLKNDEAQLYRALNDLKTEHRLLITGTPLQNSLRELWCLLDFANPQQMGTWAEFEAKHEEDQAQGFSGLHKELQPFLVRRIKKDVEKSLPAKIEQILRVGLSKKQKKYYKWILTKNFNELLKGKNGSRSSFTNIMIELKKCSNHAWLIKTPEDEEALEQKSAEERIDRILKGSGKMMLLDKLLRRLKDTGHRVLIFSQMVRMLDVIGEYMALRRFQFQRLDGGIRGDLRTRAMEHFNAPESDDFAFLLSTRAGGLGINLATADTVIIFDSDWNPQNDLQAQARAHRIGQKNTVNIYRLVSAGSIEEDVIERAKKKMVLDHLVIQRMDTSGRTVLSKKSDITKSVPFDKNEINQILKFGAEELFKDEEDNEPECDIDLILQRAETTTGDAPQTQGDELLSAFKVADFQMDEDKLWDDIIPEHDRIKQAEDDVTALGDRRAKLKTLHASGTNGSSEDDDQLDDIDVDSEGKENKDTPQWRNLTLNQTRSFLKSTKRWGVEKPEIIRSENKFPTGFDINAGTMELVESLTQCEKESAGKGKGPQLKLGLQPVPVKVTLARIRALSALHKLTEPIDDIQFPTKIRAVNNWTCNWTDEDDRQLIKSVLKYGVGVWEDVKADQDLKLTSKILPTSDDATPQGKHLSQRFDYIMKHMSNISTDKKVKPKKKKNLAEKEGSKRKKSSVTKTSAAKQSNDNNGGAVTEKQSRPIKEKLPLQASNEKKPLLDKEISLEQLGQDLPDEWFNQCKAAIKSIKPARHALKGLHQAGMNNKTVKKILPDIGSAIKKICEAKTELEERSKWKNALWRFVAQFSEMNAEQLVRIYDICISQKPKIIDRTKLDKDKKRKREHGEKKSKYDSKNKSEVDPKRHKYKGNAHSSKTSPFKNKEDRKRKFDKDRSNDYGKKWRHDNNQSRPAPY